MSPLMDPQTGKSCSVFHVVRGVGAKLCASAPGYWPHPRQQNRQGRCIKEGPFESPLGLMTRLVEKVDGEPAIVSTQGELMKTGLYRRSGEGPVVVLPWRLHVGLASFSFWVHKKEEIVANPGPIAFSQ